MEKKGKGRKLAETPKIKWKVSQTTKASFGYQGSLSKFGAHGPRNKPAREKVARHLAAHCWGLFGPSHGVSLGEQFITRALGEKIHAFALLT